MDRAVLTCIPYTPHPTPHTLPNQAVLRSTENCYKHALCNFFSRLLLCSLVFWLGWAGLSAPAAYAASATGSNLLDQAVVEVRVSLGTKANELKFVPDRLDLISGKRYKLVLNNPSTQKHYFTAKDFADNAWSQKVEAGKVEIKGAIHELELKPGAIAEWVLLPIKTGTYQLKCSIPGHAEAGMIGTIAVADGAK